MLALHALPQLLAPAAALVRPVAALWARPGYFRRDGPGSRVVPQHPVRRLGVVACNYLGDTLWTLGPLDALRGRYSPERTVIFTKPAAVDLFDGRIPRDDIVIARPVTSDRHRETTDVPALLSLAAAHRDALDLVVDLTWTRYSALFTFALRPAWSIGTNADVAGSLYSHRVRHTQRPDEHEALHAWRVIEPLVGKLPATDSLLAAPAPPVPAMTFADAAAEVGVDPHRPVSVVAPGAGWAAKQWPADAFARCAELLHAAGRQVVVTGGPSEQALCEHVAQQAAAPVVVSTAPVRTIVALLAGARAFIGNDSGLGHVAASLGVPTVSVFTAGPRPRTHGPLGPRAGYLDTRDADVTPQHVVDLLDRLA